jgi:hypothetical protein
MRMIPPVLRLFARSSMVPATPPPIHVAPRQAATPTFSSDHIAGGVIVDELDSVGDIEFFCAAFRLLGEQLAHVDTGAMIPKSRAQVHNISPEPLPRSRTRVPGSRRNASPRVASFSGVNGLWMRWALSVMLKILGMSIAKNTPLRVCD